MLATQAVHLLLFFEKGLSFGVSAEQVKELLKADSRSTDGYSVPEWTVTYKGGELQVVQLSFRMKLQEALENNRDFLSYRDSKSEEEVGVAKQAEPDDLEPSARILVVRHCDEGELGVRVECLTQLSLVPLNQIFRLPLVMERKKQLRSVWGLALIDERPVVLIDLEHL